MKKPKPRWRDLKWRRYEHFDEAAFVPTALRGVRVSFARYREPGEYAYRVHIMPTPRSVDGRDDRIWCYRTLEVRGVENGPKLLRALARSPTLAQRFVNEYREAGRFRWDSDYIKEQLRLSVTGTEWPEKR